MKIYSLLKDISSNEITDLQFDHSMEKYLKRDQAEKFP